MALSLKKQVERASIKKYKLVDAIYACAPNNITPFSECKKLASAELRAKLDDATHELIRLECEAVAKCKAWRTSLGTLIWYHRIKY